MTEICCIHTNNKMYKLYRALRSKYLLSGHYPKILFVCVCVRARTSVHVCMCVGTDFLIITHIM